MRSSFLVKILGKIIVGIIQWEARMILLRYGPKIIAVTGSVGKTSTKDALYAVLSRFAFVRKSEKSFNSDIGIPLTIIGCQNAWQNPMKWMINIIRGLLLILFKSPYPQWLVIEVGADRPGDIKRAVSWLRPHIGVVTRLATVPVHVEFFDSPAHLIAEKAELVKAVRGDGAVLLNADDANVRAFSTCTKARVVFFGLGRDTEVLGSDEEILYRDDEGRRVPDGMSFTISVGANSERVIQRGVVGKQTIYASLAAAALALIKNFPLPAAAEALSNYLRPNGRMKLIPAIKHSLIIDDSYNSSPVATCEALDTLFLIETEGRKIATLGDMMELGKYSIEEHLKLGKLAAEVVHILITVGLRAREIAEGALAAGMVEEKILQFDEAREAGKFLQNFIHEGDLLLVKGSQAVRLERLVEEIMAAPEQSSELLVRQEREWQRR